MYSSIAITALSGLALVNAQTIPNVNATAPPPGATLIEGSPTYDGMVEKGVTGLLGNAKITTNNPAGVSNGTHASI